MKVGLYSPCDFASPGGVTDHVRYLAVQLRRHVQLTVKKRGGTRIPLRTPLSSPRLGGALKMDGWAYSRCGESS